MAQRELVIVGNGMVGHHLVEQLLAAGCRDHIRVIGAEPRPAYDRVHLSEVFAGRNPEDLALATRDEYERSGVSAHFGDPVASVDAERHEVVTERGRRFAWDKLVLATGSHPFVPPVPGADQPGCFVYRTIDDLGAIRAAAGAAESGVVIGGGLLGLEAANALRNLGLTTHVVEFAPRLMGAQLDADGGAMLERLVAAEGIGVHLSRETKRIIRDPGGRLVLHFADGETLATDLIVFSAGIRPQDRLARAAGLRIGPRGGVMVDYHCRTSDSDVFAAGECALFGGRIYGLVAPGYRMAEVVAAQLTGGAAQFKGADMSTKLKLLGVDVGSIGDTRGDTGGALAYRFADEAAGVYKKVVVSADRKRLLGAVLVGECGDYDMLRQYVLNAVEPPGEPLSLILPRNDGAPAMAAHALPDGATICSCHNVTRTAILGAMDAGAACLADVKRETRAATGCGGCGALLASVVETALAERGVAVNHHLCEHFPHSRQELYHLVLVGGLRTFNALIERHGRGRGCDICKPAVASILASVHNEHVLDAEHVGLQDTNDTFMANMQKDGTYSVIPRVPAGEITPEKLIVLGNVARRHGLYTKITGAQRVDLLGARLEQLPAIWRELVDAGFETGHAYGKAVRTVKSCVGSTWCRYGVQDSVAMAIDLENRYKGLRSPHKLKFAVSGCARECAEARGKDVGVIATDKGWNLYVCGNGGMRPRHADLFATDLDEATLVRYVDRFLMFYVRTADRLQRTSVWLEHLEGGLDYLREVVIDDKLGIGAELEAQMARVIGTYRCEWKATLDDPEKLKRFRAFVNSETADDNIVMVPERGQPRPARPDEKVRLLAAENA